MPNGTIIQEIVKTEIANSTNLELHPSELEMPPLPQTPKSDYNSNFNNIHQTAINILKLQEIAKTHGHLSQDEEAKYRENLDTLNSSAEHLTNIEDDETDYEDILNINDSTGLSPWFERKKNMKKEKDKKKEEEKRKKEEEKKRKEEEKKEEEEEEEEDTEEKESEKRKKEEAKRKKEQEKKKKEEENKKKQEKEKEEEEKEKEKEKEEGNENDEEVIIDLPPDEASVAEAKPVGLAIAGAGGVAASKPIATAVVGPGGLAIARPIGTAIAGVSPDQALVPIYAEVEDAPSKKESEREKLKEKKRKLSTSEYLNRIISKYHQV